MMNSGVIYTEGDEAHGIFALSVGGGGGTGSTVVSNNVSIKAGEKSTTNSLALSIGGSGGTGGAAGTVDVINEGMIVTMGTGRMESLPKASAAAVAMVA